MDKIWQILLQQRKNGLDSGGSCDCWRLPDFELGTSLGWHSKDTKVAAFIRERRNTVFQYFSLQLAYINSYIPATCFLHIEYTYRVSSFKASHTREKSQVDTWYIQYNSIQVLKRDKSCRESRRKMAIQCQKFNFIFQFTWFTPMIFQRVVIVFPALTLHKSLPQIMQCKRKLFR